MSAIETMNEDSAAEKSMKTVAAVTTLLGELLDRTMWSAWDRPGSQPPRRWCGKCASPALL